MDVFIGNLSHETSLRDLVTFFRSLAGNARFQLFDKQYVDGTHLRFAVATIEPDKLAIKAIKKLNNQMLNGEAIVVREFLYRSYSNERRSVGWRNKPWHAIERRDLERRRKQIQPPVDFETAMGLKKAPAQSEELDLRNIKIEARGQFARKF
ncbi:MAG TPA: hypothetical protein VGE00_00190 [Gammaproteobacteria bacterium]